MAETKTAPEPKTETPAAPPVPAADATQTAAFAAATALEETDGKRLRLKLSNGGGSESVTIDNPTTADIHYLNDAVARLMQHGGDVNWDLGTVAMVKPGQDANETGTGADAVAMVRRWLED